MSETASVAEEVNSQTLTAFRHHAFLCLCSFCLAHRSISRSHLDHSVSSFHSCATASAAFIPLSPFSDKAAARGYSKWIEKILH